MSKKILLVEDEALIAMSQSKQLNKYGYEVVTAYDGETSISMVDSDSEISLVLMDIDLGQGMDGTEAARRILQKHDLPIVFLTSHSEKEYVDKVKKITGYGYVLKNSGEFVLVESIKMAYQLFDSRRRLQDKEEQLKLAMDAEDHGYWDLNLDTNEAYFSPKYCEMLGYGHEELPGDIGTWEMLLHPEDKEYAIETVNKKIKMVEPFELEFRLKTKKGTWKWIKGRGNTYRVDQNGKAHRLVGTHEDITERKKSEEQIEAREQNLRITLNSIGDAVIAVDSRGHVVRMNPVAERLCGRSINEAEGRPLEEVFYIVNANTRRVVENPVKKVMETGKIVGLANHTLLISKNGQEYQIADSAAPIQGDRGVIQGVVLVFRDVTEEYKKNRQIKESKEFLDTVMLSIQDGISVLNPDLTIQYVNPVMEKWYAANLPLIGTHCYSAYHKKDKPCAPCPSLRCMKSGKPETDIVPVEDELNSPVKWVELFSYPLVDGETGNVKGVIEFVRDISERRKAEKSLEESEARWKFALEGAGDGVWDWNAQTNRVFFSRQWKEMLGYREEEVGDTLDEWENRIHPEDRESCFADLEAHLSGKTPFYKNEHRVKCKGGEYKWILDRGKVIERANDGSPLRVIGTHADISERKENEQKIIEVQFRLQRIIDNSTFIINEIDSNGHYTLVNKATCTLVGLAKEELVGKHFREVLPRGTADIFQKRIEHVYATGEQITVDDQLDVEGEEHSFRTVLFPLYLKKQKIQSVVGIGYEITQQVNALKEKDFLMRELNHRVKNNLAMVSSLISLKDLETEDNLSDLKNRIDSIKLVHEKLHQYDDLDRIEVKEYFQELLESIFSSTADRKVNIVNNIEDVNIHTETVIPLGLVVNEIATNAIKYGFTSDEEARFTIALAKEKGANEYTLTLSNSGKSFPEEIGLENPETMGLQLVSTLIYQLRGTIELQKNPFPIFTIRFPLKNPSQE